MRKLYDFMLRLAASPRAKPALFLLSFAESSFFPIPPDVMLVPMCVADRQRAYRFAAICTLGSVLGGIAGYAIGMFFWESLGPLFMTYVPGVTESGFARVKDLYDRWDFWVVFTAGLSPIPYKLITITAGVFSIAFPVFVVASVVSRGARFFAEAWVCRRFGGQAQALIERHFNLVATAFVILLVGGFVLAAKL